MSVINVNCTDHTMNFTNMPIISSGSVNVDEIQFTFDSSWDGFTSRICTFYKNGKNGTYYHSALNSANVATIPTGVMREKGRIYFGVSAKNGTQIKTSEILCYHITEGTYNEAADSDHETFTEIKNQMLAIKAEIDESASNILNVISNARNDLSSELSQRIADTENDVETLDEKLNEYILGNGTSFSLLNWQNTTGLYDSTGEIKPSATKRTILTSFVEVNKGDKIFIDSDNVEFCTYCYDENEVFKGYLTNVNIDSERANWTNSIVFREINNVEYLSGSTRKSRSIECPMKVRFVVRPVDSTAVNCDELIDADVLKNLFQYVPATNSEVSITQLNFNRRNEKDVEPLDYPLITLPTGYSLSDYVNMVVRNYNSFMSEVKGNENRIPFIAFSDVHKDLSNDYDLFRLINDIVDWNEISAVLSMGDIVEAGFDQTHLDGYAKVMDNIPLDKRIDVMGNHDAVFGNGANSSKTDNVFKTVRAHRFDSHSNFTVEDDYWNVRYLATNFMSFDRPRSYEHNGVLTSQQADWIIEELSKDDRKDVIMLSHIYYYSGNSGDKPSNNEEGQTPMVTRDPQGVPPNYSVSGLDFLLENQTTRKSFREMIEARKNKGAGSLIDSEGNSHTYDFSNCKGDLLITLHGHHHQEGYKTTNGLTQFLFYSFGKYAQHMNCFYFAYIDRELNKLKVWRNIMQDDGVAWGIDI